MRAVHWSWVALIGCAPVEPGATPAAPVTAEATALPAELHGVVQPWQRVEPGWLARASVWLVADYTQGTYPCVEGPGGSLDMFLRDSFAPKQVLRGSVAARSFDVDAYALRGPAYPPALTEGRSYLVLLAPTPAIAARLADPAGMSAMHERLGDEQVVAVIDLSQSAAEAEAGRVVASRSGGGDGAPFDPAIWAAAREAPAISAAQHGPVARFVGSTLLRDANMTLPDVRAWVGAPDVEQRRARGLLYRYWLARGRYEQPVDGAIYGQLELQFLDDVLRRGSLRYFRWQTTTGGLSSLAIPAAELETLGLAEFVLGPE